MAKDNSEKFFDEIARAVETNDAEAISILMAPEDELKEDDKPNQEVVADDKVNLEDKGDDKTTDESDDDKTALETDPDDTSNKEDEDEVGKLRRELEEARNVQHRLKSDAGRVPGLQRKLVDLDRRLQEMAEKSAKSDTDDDNGDASLADAFDNEHFQLIKETDPTLAAALEATLGRMAKSTRKQSVEAAREVTNTFREVEEHQEMVAEFDKLVGAVPEAPEIFKSPEWTQYKDTLTPNQRRLAESAYAEDVIVAIERFNVAFGKGPSKQAGQVDEERERKLKTRTPGSSTATPAPRTDANDPSALFNKTYEEIRQLNQRPIR